VTDPVCYSFSRVPVHTLFLQDSTLILLWNRPAMAPGSAGERPVLLLHANLLLICNLAWEEVEPCLTAVWDRYFGSGLTGAALALSLLCLFRGPFCDSLRSPWLAHVRIHQSNVCWHACCYCEHPDVQLLRRLGFSQMLDRCSSLCPITSYLRTSPLTAQTSLHL